MADLETTVIEQIDAGGNGLRIEFVKQGDRFGHLIYVVRAGETLPILRSIEGDAEDFEPPSPPFAELHRQGELVFLSGATTLGHWSASVETPPERFSDRRCVPTQTSGRAAGFGLRSS